MKIEWVFKPTLCTYRLTWTGNLLRMVRWMRWHCPQNKGFEIRAVTSEAEQATSRSRMLPTIFNLYKWVGKKHFVSLKLSKEKVLAVQNRLGSPTASITAYMTNSHSMRNRILDRWLVEMASSTNHMAKIWVNLSDNITAQWTYSAASFLNNNLIVLFLTGCPHFIWSMRQSRS